MSPRPLLPLIWVVSFGAVLIWSAIGPKDYPTWWLEVTPALIGAGVLALSRKRFPLTPLVYGLILLHCMILMVGGHYTYAEVPLFDWLRDVLGQERNNFDRPGLCARFGGTRDRAAQPGVQRPRLAEFLRGVFLPGAERRV